MTRVICSSIVWTCGGSRPSSPYVARSARVKAVPLLSKGSCKSAEPVGNASSEQCGLFVFFISSSRSQKQHQHLRRHDAQNHHQWVNGCIRHRRGFRAGELSGERQGRGIGHAAREQTAQREKVQLIEK